MSLSIPTNPATFKDWADRACVDWPADLQTLAYQAWREMQSGKTELFDKFTAQYEARVNAR